MHVKQKLMYMGFGCLLTLAGYILASFSNDSVAQSGVQGKIVCRGLTVVDEEGNESVVLYNVSMAALYPSKARTAARPNSKSMRLVGGWLLITRPTKTCFRRGLKVRVEA